MALGAIQAIEEAGKRAGTDIVIVSIDGVHDAFQAILDGKLNCTVECNPLIGPQVFDAVEKYLAGEELPKRIQIRRRRRSMKTLSRRKSSTNASTEHRKHA